MDLVRKLAGRRLEDRVCASYDVFLDSLGAQLSTLDLVARLYTPEGERTLKMFFVGAKFTRPVYIEANGDIHPISVKEAELRNLSYCIPLYSDVHIHRSNGPSSILHDTFLGNVPLMVGSRRCPEPRGGWFCIHGSRKSIVEQRAHLTNHPIVYHKTVAGVHHWTVVCKSSSGTNVYVTSIKLHRGRLAVTFPKLEREVDLGSLLRLLGHAGELRNRDLFHATEDEGQELRLKSTYLIGEEDRVRDALETQLLPHTSHKGFYLMHMCDVLADHIRRNTWTDKDSLFNQKVETVSDLLSSLTTNLLRKMRNEMRSYLQRLMQKRVLRDSDVAQAVKRQTSLTDGLSFAFATGSWNTTLVDKRIRPGVCQLLNRGSPVASLSQLRRVKSSLRPEQKLTAPRLLHHSTIFRLCPFDTPEGASVGLETTLALGASISMDRPLDLSIMALVGPGDGTYVFVDGTLVGGTLDPEGLCAELRAHRRAGRIAKDISVAYRENVHVRTSRGRIIRVLRRNVPPVEGPLEAIEGPYLEWLDVYEEDTMLVAMDDSEVTPEHTHVEVHPGLMLGLAASMIPFPGRKPGARVVYQCSMGKQAISPLLDLDIMDTTTNAAMYSQKPLVRTELSGAFLEEHMDASGFNAIVAVMPSGLLGRSGCNQEDSLVFNQGFVDRGGGRSVQYKTVKVSLGSNPGEKVVIGVTNRAQMRPCNLEGGLPRVGQVVVKGEYLVGRTKISGKAEMDDSVFSPMDGVVDRILKIVERSGSTAYHIRLRRVCIPQLGDKYANRDSQKGVVGCLMPQEDAPFSKDGISPDILINPHAFPSRMTVSYLLSGALAKLGCMEGKFKNGSAFSTIGDLQKLRGKETLYNGKTGEAYREKIFIVPMFYQKLKHMAQPKLHVRARGMINELTRAPAGGKAKKGGLRFGEMERDALVSHGAANMLHERLCLSSDLYHLPVCPKCQSYDCKHRKTKVKMSYAYKLLLTELQAMGIRPRIHI